MSQVNYKKASAYYLIGNLFNHGMSFLTVPIFTRILSTTDYGIVTTYNSWVSILAMVIGFALHMGIRAAFVDHGEKMHDFMAVTTTFTVESGLVLAGIVVAVLGFGRINLGWTLVLLCLLQGLSSALIQNYSMYLMMKYRYKFRTALMILPNLISTLISIGVIMWVIKSDLYMGRIVPAAVTHALFGLIVIALVYRKSRVLYNREYLSYALKISAPLVLHGIALQILFQSDRTMITLLADASQTGIYSLIYNFSTIGVVLTSALEGVWVPWFMRKYQERDIDTINTRAVDYVHIITYAMAALILVGPEVVKLLASEKYWEGIVIIPPIVLSNYVNFLYTLYVNVEHFHKKTVVITSNTLIAAGVNLALNYIFIPKYGYVAAAYTTLAAYMVSFGLHTFYAKKLEAKLYPFSKLAPSILHVFAATMVFYIFQDFGWLRWSIMLCYIAAVVWINREQLAFFLKKKTNG